MKFTLSRKGPAQAGEQWRSLRDPVSAEETDISESALLQGQTCPKDWTAIQGKASCPAPAGHTNTGQGRASCPAPTGHTNIMDKEGSFHPAPTGHTNTMNKDGSFHPPQQAIQTLDKEGHRAPLQQAIQTLDKDGSAVKGF